jgi:hypothetical protein
MNKAQAAQFLGISVRTLQRYMSKHQIGFDLRQTKAGDEAIFDRDELQRFKKELKEGRTTVKPSVARMVEAITAPASTDEAEPSAQTALARIDLLQSFAAMIQDIQKPAPAEPVVAIESKLMLTLKEASQFSGISQYKLKELIRAKKLKPILGIGRARKLKREDLIAYVKNL